LTVSCDSNVLIYAFSKQDKVYPEARLIVQGLVRLGTILCDQTIREFLAVAHRRRIISPENARSIATTFIDQFELSRAEAEDLLEASKLAERHRLQYYDALLCCTARRSGCSFLLSRDMQDGFLVGTMRIVNPFLPENKELVGSLLF
jgi:predicted nucleic acid-binding protein